MCLIFSGTYGLPYPSVRVVFLMGFSLSGLSTSAKYTLKTHWFCIYKKSKKILLVSNQPGDDSCHQSHRLRGAPVLSKRTHGMTLQLVHGPVLFLSNTQKNDTWNTHSHIYTIHSMNTIVHYIAWKVKSATIHS